MIVDDHKLFTAGLSAILQLIDRDVEIEECSCGRQALSRLDTTVCPDLLIVDLDMPTLSGLDLMRAIKSRKLCLKVAVISASTDNSAIQAVMDCGALGYIPKSLSPQLMLQGINTILNGQAYIPEHLKTQLHSERERPIKVDKGSSNTHNTQDSEKLTERHLQILGFIERGLTNKEIANVLGITVSTVKFHITSLYKILNVKNRTQCIHVALERRLIGNS